MADSDVDVILQNYFEAIAEKDSDALKLFEDNKRMRALVEQTLKAREELEIQLRAAQTLVASLQADLREKQHLIETQDKKCAVWREDVGELRSLLERPSDLNHGLRDIVNGVKDVLAELRSARQNIQNAQWCCDQWEAYVFKLLLASEARERHLLESVSAHSLRELREAMSEIYHFYTRVSVQQAAAEATIAKWESWQRTMQQDYEFEEKKHAEALQRVGLEAHHYANIAQSAKRNAEDLAGRLRAQAFEEHVSRAQSALEAEENFDLVEILAHRCTAAEVNWYSAVFDVRTVTQHLKRSVEKLNVVSQSHEEALLERHQSRLRISKLTKKLEGIREQQSELEDLQHRYNVQQEELQNLKHKYVSLADKERNLRYQLSTSAETAAAKLLSVEESLRTAEQRSLMLEDRLHAAREEARSAQKEASVLQQKMKQQHATEALLEATQQQLRETEKHAFNFQEALDTLKEDHRAQLQTERDRHAAEVAELEEANEKTLQMQVSQARVRLEEAEERTQHAQATAALEKKALQEELQEWSAEVDRLKSDIAKSRQSAEAEKAARKVLEQQCRSETSVMRSMVERSLDEAQRGPQLVELQAKLRIVQERHDVLEEACRRSACVIARLREALHREQMTSRALRLQDNVLAA